MAHPFITQWTNPTHYIITQLNGMIFCPGKNSLSFGDPLHVVPLVGAAVSTPRLARRADVDQLCRFESWVFCAVFAVGSTRWKNCEIHSFLPQLPSFLLVSSFLLVISMVKSPHFPDKMSRFFARLWFREYGDSTLDLNFRVQWESNAGGHRWGFLT